MHSHQLVTVPIKTKTKAYLFNPACVHNILDVRDGQRCLRDICCDDDQTVSHWWRVKHLELLLIG